MPVVAHRAYALHHFWPPWPFPLGVSFDSYPLDIYCYDGMKAENCSHYSTYPSMIIRDILSHSQPILRLCVSSDAYGPLQEPKIYQMEKQ